MERIKEKWKSMDPEEKKVYDDMNLKDKERVKMETKNFKQQQREARKAAGHAGDSGEESAEAVVRYIGCNLQHNTSSIYVFLRVSPLCVYTPSVYFLPTKICAKLA